MIKAVGGRTGAMAFGVRVGIGVEVGVGVRVGVRVSSQWEGLG